MKPLPISEEEEAALVETTFPTKPIEVPSAAEDLDDYINDR